MFPLSKKIVLLISFLLITKMAAGETHSRLNWGEINEETNDLLLNKDTSKNDKAKTNWNSFEIPPVYQPSSSQKGPKKE